MYKGSGVWWATLSAVFVIFAGLPGVGKTAIARELARELNAVYVRADTIEQAIRDAGLSDQRIGGMGYHVARQIAEENLALGNVVVTDSVNPWELTREAYRGAARRSGVPYLDVEVVCGDPEVHRIRVETRTTDVAGLVLPTWAQVVERDYQPWVSPRLKIDTAELTIGEAIAIIRQQIALALA
jgi:predicted kinase